MKLNVWFCRWVCDALHHLLEVLFIRFGSGLCRQVVGISLDGGWVPLVGGLFCVVMRGASCCLFLQTIRLIISSV